MRPPLLLPRDTRGTALVIVLFLIAALAGLVAATAPLLVDALRTSMSRSAARGTRDAAGSAAAVLGARLASLAAERLGDLAQPDLDALAASVSTLPAPGGGMTLRTGPGETGVVLLRVRRNHPLAYDETPREVWTDQPRRRWDVIPPVGGLVASQTLDFLVFATVEGAEGARSTARAVVSVSRVPPHQDALYVAGDAEICAAGGSVHRIHGTVRVDGSLRLADCGGTVEYTGGIELTGDLRVDGAPGLHQLAGDAGALPLASLASGTAELDPDAAAAAWGGRLRMAGALGGRLPATRFATAAVAGSGDCLDFVPGADAACGGAAAYHPTLQVWGDGSSPAHRCGAGWGGSGCAPALAALTWTRWPFAGGVDLSTARPDPADPGRLWKGLYPDPRREARCTATVAGTRWRTFRCPGNAWGWALDAGALPVLPGGLLSVARSAGMPPEANPDGTREVLVVRNSAEIAGPLTIHSQLPVVVVGSFNVVDPKPAMIHAPRITVLPAEAELALRTTSVWDSVAGTGGGAPRALPLVAQSNVTIYAVLRMQTCRRIGAADHGGSWRAAPAVLGDWSRVGLRIVGAVQVEDRTSDGLACASWGAPLNGAPPSGTPTLEPRSRELLYDPRLLHPGFQPPGSWTAANIPAQSASGAPGRTAARQGHATGGTVVLHIRSAGVGGPLKLPAAVPFPGPPPLPSPPPPLPQ
jgi:hypothetical protein